ncbi:hypothetical protein GCM10022392_24380 [Mucilaginibacter panaciglaebae]|uniref:Tetratricopeptide repeat protein n=1 Tax=Mucilaginibacter panaciglaebae TaxID=502331 RepID=A0ABP7WXW5_9SPHI
MQATAQKDLNFDKRFVESVNHWTALYTGKDSVYNYGYIYMDPKLGLAVHNEGTFKITGNNAYVPTKRPFGAINTLRLQNNKTKVAWIPENRFPELQITANPDWLSALKIDTASAAYLLKWAFTYNDGHESNKALPYLERVKQIDPNYPGLDFEFAYYYNANRQFNESEALLRKSLAVRPDDFRVYKELIYEEVFSNNLAMAEKTYQLALPHSNTEQKAELSYNICLIYFQQKNEPKFNQWAAEAKKWVVPGTKQMETLTRMMSSPMN